MNLADFLRAQTREHAAAPALFCGTRSITYQQLDASTDRLAAQLLAQGLQPGDRVAVQWPNAIEVVQLFFAAFKAGLIVVPINLRLKPGEVAWLLEHSGSTLCFAPPPFADGVRPSGVRVLSELPVDDPPTTTLPDVDPQSPALILYTSGSTGRPKGAVLTHQILLATGDICTLPYAQASGAVAGARPLLMTPLMHASGIYVLFFGLAIGGGSVLLPMFDPAATLDAAEQFRCTLTLALPAMMQFMVEEQARRPRDLSSLRAIFAGGDSVPVSLQERVRQLIGATVVEGLAQTETGPTIANTVDAPIPGALGKVHPGIDVRIVDPFGTDVPEGEPGELVLRSPAVFAGYWRDPDATASALRDGWFHTGDLVSRDREGYYWFRGRLKEIIVRGGSNISPQEVEEALYTHPAVLEAGVIGAPHEVWGEVVIAVVSLREGRSATEAELREHARQTLADYKVPERVHVLPALPKGATGKVHRSALREMVARNPAAFV
jgi:long-chain acyl-CoA synthetase